MKTRSRPVSVATLEFAAGGVALASGAAVYLTATPVWAAPVATVAAWGVLQLLVVRPFARASRRAEIVEDDDFDFDVTIAGVRASAARILELSGQARDPLVRERGAQIVAALNRVIRHLIEDPDDVASSQRFLVVYVERAKSILVKYVQYENLTTPQAEQVRAKVRDELLPILVTLCEQQLHRITYDDLRSFETDIEVLKKSIQLEGL